MPRDETKRIAFASHAPNIPTGFGRVSKEVSEYLGQFYKMFAVGWQFQGFPMQTELFTLCPTAQGGNYNEFGQVTFQQFVPTFQPQILIGLADYFVWAHGYEKYPDCWLPRFLWDVPNRYKIPAPKWVWYFPIDSAPLLAPFKQLLQLCEYPVAMSQFGKAICEDAGIFVDYIPHGVRPEIFKVPTEQEKINARKDISNKLNLQSEGIDLTDKFIFYAGGRNQLRKQNSVLIEAASRFLERTKAYDEVYFLFHTTYYPGQVGYTMPMHIERWGLNRKNIELVNAGSIYLPMDGWVAHIMRACDCYIDTAGGEGFGFFRIESAACGQARIMPAFSTGLELMGEEPRITIEDTYSDNRKDGTMGLIKTPSGFIIPSIERLTHGLDADFCIPDMNYLVDAMIYCYEHQEETKQMGIKGREFVVDNYRWEKILPQWKKLMDQVFDDISRIQQAEVERQKFMAEMKQVDVKVK